VMSKCRKIILIVPLMMSILMLVLSVWCSRQEAPSAPKLDVGLTGVNPTKEYRNAGIPSGELKIVELPTIKGKKTKIYDR